MPAFDPTEIVSGPLYLYLGKSALEATPDVLPADATLFGAAWGGTWRNLGWSTPDGFTAAGLSQEKSPVNTAQQRPAVTFLAGNAAETVGFTLIQATLQNIKDMAGRGQLTTVAAGAGTYGHTDLKFSDSAVAYVALGIEAFGLNGRPRRMIYPIGMMSVTGDLSQTFTQEMRIPAQFMRAGGPTGDPVWRDILLPTS